MSVQVTLDIVFRPEHLRQLHNAIVEVFGAENVEVLPGLLGTAQERREAIARALQGQGLAAQTWRELVHNALVRVRAGTPGVSPYGDLAVVAEGTIRRPTIRLSYDQHGTRQELIRRVLQGYARAVVIEAARAWGGRIRRETVNEKDGTLVVQITF